jgi:hypothetical protein
MDESGSSRYPVEERRKLGKRIRRINEAIWFPRREVF